MINYSVENARETDDHIDDGDETDYDEEQKESYIYTTTKITQIIRKKERKIEMKSKMWRGNTHVDNSKTTKCMQGMNKKTANRMKGMNEKPS